MSLVRTMAMMGMLAALGASSAKAVVLQEIVLTLDVSGSIDNTGAGASRL